ncbi:unnamed protein product [Closterium sp. Naga37s-1]|nr:unnamed protein product [Closterium sp. Naga37s-1]
MRTFLLTDKSDVYNYGEVLQELLSGKFAIHEKQPPAYWEYLMNSERLVELLDPSLSSDYDLYDTQILCDIARSYVQVRGSDYDLHEAHVNEGPLDGPVGHQGRGIGVSGASGARGGDGLLKRLLEMQLGLLLLTTTMLRNNQPARHLRQLHDEFAEEFACWWPCKRRCGWEVGEEFTFRNCQSQPIIIARAGGGGEGSGRTREGRGMGRMGEGRGVGRTGEGKGVGRMGEGKGMGERGACSCQRVCMTTCLLCPLGRMRAPCKGA